MPVQDGGIQTPVVIDPGVWSDDVDRMSAEELLKCSQHGMHITLMHEYEVVRTGDRQAVTAYFNDNWPVVPLPVPIATRDDWDPASFKRTFTTALDGAIGNHLAPPVWGGPQTMPVEKPMAIEAPPPPGFGAASRMGEVHSTPVMGESPLRGRQTERSTRFHAASVGRRYDDRSPRPAARQILSEIPPRTPYKGSPRRRFYKSHERAPSSYYDRVVEEVPSVPKVKSQVFRVDKSTKDKARPAASHHTGASRGRRDDRRERDY